MQRRYTHLSVAIPMLAESKRVPALMKSLRRQRCRAFTVYCCVNNPEGWETSEEEEARMQYTDNQITLKYLRSVDDVAVVVVDRSSSGKGWPPKRCGVGWARKVLFDTISSSCDADELIVSLDADTHIDENYLECILETMNAHPSIAALSVPYCHPLCGEETIDRAMLRYELYMRHYLINLLEMKNPYAFTALGSAMVFPLWAYRRVGGITPLQGGEDFYLMQKFAKSGRLLKWCDTEVYPAGRPSTRVPFGTGPAIAKGVEAMDAVYPFYPQEAFAAVAETFACFPRLYDEEFETPMSAFLREQLRTDCLWQPLRKNFKSRELFVHACEERVDGLRILQYLRTYRERQQRDGCCRKGEEELQVFCSRHGIMLHDDFDFCKSEIGIIEDVRNALRRVEMNLRKTQ